MHNNNCIVIPDRVFADKNISTEEKLVIALICNTTNKYGNCSASDDYISECLNTTHEKVQSIVSKLVEMGYICIENSKGNMVLKLQPMLIGQADTESEVEIYPTFDSFWSAYDKKVGRLKAERLWKKLKQKEKEAIMEYLPKYVAATPDKQFRKNPETFLRNKSWQDELIINKFNTNGQYEVISRLNEITSRPNPYNRENSNI